jgi:hypothetical protein
MSLAAVGQLQAFVHFQRTYRRRRRDLIRLADDLDRAADAGSAAADVEHVDGR